MDQTIWNQLKVQEDSRLNEFRDHYLQKIKPFLETEVSDALAWKCPQAASDDWDNVPEVAV